MSNYGQEVVDRGLERLKGTWEYNGEEYDLLVEDISYPDFKLVQQYGALSAQFAAIEDGEDVDAEGLEEQVENLGDFSWEAEDEDPDFIPGMIDEKLVRPEVDPSETPTQKLRALVEGMMGAWQESEDIAEAREEMPLEGNG
jgi:hypothetical protein